MGVLRLGAGGLSAVGLAALAAAGGAGSDDKKPVAPTARRAEPTEKDRAVLARLEAPVPLTFKDAPFEDVLRFITSATRGPGDSGIPIVVDPEGMKRAGMTAQTRVSIVSEPGDPLKTTLGRLLGPRGLRFEVKDGRLRVTVNAPFGPVLMVLDRVPQNKAILAKLDKPVALDFNDAPLETVLKFIRSATQGPGDNGVPVYVDPVGLLEAGATMKSPVSVHVSGVPLRSTLTWLLDPLGLTYTVKDGLLTVTSKESLDEDLKAKDAPAVKGAGKPD
jgi:hypothetical protein